MQSIDRSPRNLITIDRVAKGGMGLGLAMLVGAVADMPNSERKFNSAEKAILVQFPVDTDARDRASAVVRSFQQQIDQAVADGNTSAMVVLATSEKLGAVQKAKSDLQVVTEQQGAQDKALDTDLTGRLRLDTTLAAGGIMLFFGSNHLRRQEREFTRKEAAPEQRTPDKPYVGGHSINSVRQIISNLRTPDKSHDKFWGSPKIASLNAALVEGDKTRHFVVQVDLKEEPSDTMLNRMPQKHEGMDVVYKWPEEETAHRQPATPGQVTQVSDKPPMINLGDTYIPRPPRV